MEAALARDADRATELLTEHFRQQAALTAEAMQKRMADATAG